MDENNYERPDYVEQEPAPKKTAGNFFAKVFSRKYLPATIAVLAGAVILIVLIACLFSYLGPKSVAERYLSAYIYDNHSTLAKLSAYDYKEYLMRNYDDEEEYFEAMSDDLDEDITSWSQFSKICVANRKEDIEDEYGKYKLTFDATRVKDLSAKKLESEFGGYTLNLLEDYDFDIDDYDGGKVVTVKVKLTGEDDNEKETAEVILVRSGLTWKVVDCSFD